MNKQYRVKKNEEIQEIIKGRISYGNKHFVVYKKENNEANNFRYAISVGKKIGNAVKRNRIKRQITSIVDQLAIPNNIVDVFIIAKPSVCDLSYADMVKQIVYLFNKLNIKHKGA